MSAELEQGAATTVAPPEYVIFTDLGAEEGVLVDLNTKQYYRLNATASFIWRGLARGAGADQIAADLTEEYDVTRERALSSVQTTIDRFKANLLLTVR